MFEIIGLIISIAVFFLLSAVAGCIYAALAWLLVGSRGVSAKLKLVIAFSLPPACAAYMLLCAVVFSILIPGESGTLFGDISQPLPNGYSLQALGKMPDFATINKGYDLSEGSVPLKEYVGSVGVHGNLVVGQYSHPMGTFDPHPNEGYFAFDTITGKNVDYASRSALEAAIGTPVILASAQYFRSQEPRYVRTEKVEQVVLFAPPICLLVGYLLILLKMRRINPPSSALRLSRPLNHLYSVHGDQSSPVHPRSPPQV